MMVTAVLLRKMGLQKNGRQIDILLKCNFALDSKSDNQTYPHALSTENSPMLCFQIASVIG